MVLQENTSMKIIQIAHKFKFIHTEYWYQEGLDSGKTNALLDIINNRPGIDKGFCMLRIQL